MSNGARSAERPVWSEGMLLSPQHLQALDRYHESLLAARVGALTPSDFGVLEVEFDRAALAAGQVRLVRFAGVLPDGLPVSFDGPEEGPPPRDAAERLAAQARSLEVHLAVPRERAGVPSFGEAGVPPPSRFVATQRALADATAPGEVVQVRLARPNATLLLGDEPREDYESLKIAEIARTSSGQLALQENFVPACLRLSASPWLLGGVRDLLARAIAKHRELSETRRHREAASELTGPDVTRLLQLLVVNGFIPVLAHLSEAGEASPRECYLLLSQLAAQAGTFRGADPSSLPKLQPTDLRSTFEPLLARLGEELGGMAVQRYVVVPLEKRPGGLSLARFADERLLKAALFLGVKSEHPEAMVVEQLPRLCKVASAADIQALIQAATTGLALQVAHRPPPELPVRPEVVYFALVPGDRYWQGIVAARNIALYLPPPFDPARTTLELFAIPQEPSPPAVKRF
ncbi:MAG TPA: type VI secretion system baseplate subunit TssK [Anaeromyxobacteraceae bacterium]|nr:type VI secretion system baseplate subunit TssK [Anaeromyxobacteraceae bacterium]